MTFTASGYVGTKWAVSVDWQYAHIENLHNGEVFTTTVIRFPVGYRVGRVWTNGVGDCTAHLPDRVKRKARTLARTIG